jgi:hypothetical protein
MRVAIIGEGQTEYYCVPKIAGKLGNIVVGHVWTRTVSTEFDWERYFQGRVVPLVRAMLAKGPDKIVIVVDREDRPDCGPDLATRGLKVILCECGHLLGICQISVVISNKGFECLLFADYGAVDSLKILKGAVSHGFPESTEGQNVLKWIKQGLKPGASYDKIRDGMFLAQRMNLSDPTVVARSRSLRKLLKELR